MPYTTELMTTKRVIYTRFLADVSMEDIAQETEQVREFLDKSEESLSLLTDVTEVRTQPNQFVEIWLLAKPVIKHKRLNAWIVVGVQNHIARLLLKMLARFGAILYVEFETPEEGFAFLDGQVAS